jgi:hypothetical protein
MVEVAAAVYQTPMDDPVVAVAHIRLSQTLR